ncbi:uncharacterized protein LOC110661892 isoform X3 [Hevea brasiliensis]|uniref:uncharacterized protein LOC110661892 isoform X3 n=1 Tax=Hevea brasiliensis TaxID=3981 RepID=UPI0025DAB893|nr:uncharacterized protein LOC110661892 isoform X3 [Hevea brasiliensis]
MALWVDQDLSYLTTFEDEVTRLQQYLPEYKMDCFDGTIGFETFNSLKGFSIESFSCAFDYDHINFDGDALDLYLAQEGEETKVEGNSNRLQVTNKKVLLGDFRTDSACKETLGAEPADEAPNLSCGSCEKTSLGNVALKSHSPHFQERDCHAEISNLSSSSETVLESARDRDSLLLDKMTAQDLCQVFSRIFGCETSVKDKQWLKHRIAVGLQNRGELVDSLNLLESGETSKADEEKAVVLLNAALSGSASDLTDTLENQLISREKHVKRMRLASCNSLKSVSSPVREVGFCSVNKSNTADALVTQKQTHWPTGICTKGLQEQNSRYHHRKCRASYKNARDEFLNVKIQKQHCQKGIGTAQLSCQEESLKGSCVQVPLDLPVQIGESTKDNHLVNDFDNCKDNEVSVSDEDFDRETSSADSQISEDDSVTRRKRARKRKQHHRRWTPSEVMKLIEGVSKCGVGKWTHIKKLLFSSSSHRTSVNLKDKWRNLLKASNNEMQKKRKVEQGETQLSHQLSESIWCQVRELAVIYSYPRESKSKV